MNGTNIKIDKLVLGMLNTNCYIVHKGTECIVIDPADKPKAIIDRILELGLTIKAILLTHAHNDHCMACSELMTNNVPVYVHKGDYDKTDGDLYWSKWLNLKKVTFRATDELTDGAELKIAGLEITVLHTPGHSDGSCCFIIEGKLFSGDTLFNENIGRTDLRDGNFDSLIKSIKDKLLTLPNATIVYPGHGAPTTIGAEVDNVNALAALQGE